LRKIVIAALLGIAFSGVTEEAVSGTLYHCVNGDSIRSYTSKPIEGAECRVVKPSPRPQEAISQAPGRWQFVGTGSDGRFVSFDRPGMTRSGDVVTAWVQHIGAEKPLQTIAQKVVHKILYRERIYCSSMTSGLVAMIAYDKEGGVIVSTSDPYPTAEPISPDSVGEMTAKAVCDING
jgi:hypothetical protein